MHNEGGMSIFSALDHGVWFRCGVSRLLRQFVDVETIVQSCILLPVCSSLFRSSREHESARVTIFPGVLGVTPLHSTVRMSQCTHGYGETVVYAKD